MIDFKKADKKKFDESEVKVDGLDVDLESANIFHELNKEDVTDPKLKWRKTLTINDKDGYK